MTKIITILFHIFTCFILIMMNSTFFVALAQDQVSFSSALLGIEGIWEGKLKVPGTELRIVFRIIKTPEGNLTATMDSPDQGVTGIPVDAVILQDSNLSIEVKAIAGIYEGIISQDYSIIEGDWKQAGASFPLFLQKIEKAVEISRPQEPKKPFPYIEEEINYENMEAGIMLAGTLTIPAEEGLFPAVLLISGSGPQDRNETVFGHQPFLVLADYLTRQGIAVLRVDDRGVGESKGDFSKATSKDFASDVQAGIKYLKTREEINPKQIGLIGHSEGGIIAPMVAIQSPDVAFIVLMAGPGLPGEDILYMQNELISKAAGMIEEKINRNRYYNEKLYSLIKEEGNKEILLEKASSVFDEYFAELTQEEKSQIGDRDKYIDVQLQNMLSSWFKFFLTYDPRPTLSKVSCPVLAMIGSKDLQVPPKENLKAIEEALIAGGNNHYLIKELPGLNHVFQKAETGSPDEYARIEETISPVALELIGDWVLGQIS
jgi:uncharacterized protein